MENVGNIMKELHVGINKSNAAYVRAAVTCSLTVGFAGANLEGWITYNDERYGKIYFKSEKITEHTAFCACLGASPDVMVLVPEKIETHGRFQSSGGGLVSVAGLLMLFNAEGINIFQKPFPVAGTGAPYWSASGEVNYKKSK